jgi:sugar phosphate isomerase/epimerase
MYPLYLTQNSVASASPLELIEIASQTGFEGISLRLVAASNMPFFPVAGDKELIAAIKAALAKSRIRLLEIYTLYIRPEFDLAQLVAAMQVGAELGASYAMVLCFDPDPARREDRFGRLCDAGASLGLGIGLEMAPTSIIRTGQDAAALIAAAGRKNASVVADPANLARAKSNFADLATIDPGLWRYTQLNDLDIASDELRMLGEGDLPLRELLAILPAGIPLIMEISERRDKPAKFSPHEWAERIAKSARAFLHQ